jgi:U3 small nucleolar ribonucleoprotein protein IMP4
MTERQIAPYEKFLLTTSRKPSPRTRSFVRDVTRVIPWSFHFTRGSCSLADIADELSVLGINRCLILHEKNGNPSLVKFYKLKNKELVERDYKVRIKGIALARELKRGRSVFTKESKFRVINQCTSKFGEKLYRLLSIFFDFTKERELPRIPNLKGIALLFSDTKNNNITIQFQQIETQEMVGPKIIISKLFLGKKGEALSKLLDRLGIGKNS